MAIKTTRRSVMAGALGAALSVTLLAGHRTLAQSATPVMGTPSAAPAHGYAVARIHTLNAAELVPEIDKLVIAQFVPQLQQLPGFLGYILADSLDNPKSNFSISWFDTKASATASTTASANWVKGLDPKFQHAAPVALDGTVLIAAPGDGAGTPAAATPGPAAGYVAIRRYHGAPGKDQASLAPTVLAGFVPILKSVAGFRGYLWYPVADGRVSVSLFDTQASAEESTTKAADWVAKNTSDYAVGKPDVYNGKIVYADIPTFGVTVR